MQDSMRQVEYRFNRKFNYGWVFMNDEPFTEEFKAGVRKITRGECTFGSSALFVSAQCSGADFFAPQRSFPLSTGATQLTSIRLWRQKAARQWLPKM